MFQSRGNSPPLGNEKKTLQNNQNISQLSQGSSLPVGWWLTAETEREKFQRISSSDPYVRAKMPPPHPKKGPPTRLRASQLVAAVEPWKSPLKYVLYRGCTQPRTRQKQWWWFAMMMMMMMMMIYSKGSRVNTTVMAAP